MSIFDIWLLITSLWYLLAIVLHVRLWYLASDYPFGIFWPLHSMSVFDIRLLITSLWYLLAIVLDVRLWYPASDYFPLVSFGHCSACPSLISGFWLPLWYLLAIVLDVRLWYRLLITPLVSFGHCIGCPSLIFGFWLPLWYLLAIVLHVRLWYSASDYPFGIFWPLYCMSVFDIWLLITPLVSFGHCIPCPYLISGFWLPPWLFPSNVSYIESAQMYQHEIIMIKYRALFISKFV